MATYPIKMLKDEQNIPFVPLVSTDGVQDPEGLTLEQRLLTKLGPSNLLGGENISVRTEGYNCYIDLDLPSQLTVINNLTTASSGQGALDAYQGKVLNDKIPSVIDDITSTSTSSALSANQGYILNTRLTTVETNGIIGATQYGGTIVTNLNTISKGGFYTALGTATGVPNSSYSWFITHQNSNTGTLSATQRAVAYSTSLIIYERVMQSSTWGAWVNRSTVNNLTTASAGNGVLDAYQGKVLDDKINGNTLWTNPSPNSSFAGQTIDISTLSNYRYIEIECEYNNSTVNVKNVSKLNVVVNNKLDFFMVDGGTANTIYMREFTIQTSSILISEAFIPGTGYFNNYVIPIKIIGYK